MNVAGPELLILLLVLAVPILVVVALVRRKP
jgi:hypothetical protein